MYLLTLRDSKDEGAYAVQDRHGHKVLFLFEEEDDAERYAMMLEDGINEINWNAMFESFARIQRDKKGN